MTPLLLEALARTMMARDPDLDAHARRVREGVIALARRVGMKDPNVLDAIGGAALVHDIGKLGIPDHLLHKPAPLTPEEYERVKQHVTIGADLLAAARVPRELALIVRHHHELWDGSGYPDGLEGERIPVGARILAIVDCYDALTSWRPYRVALTHDAAVSHVAKVSGHHFDPVITEAFMGLLEVFRDHARPERRAQVRVV